MSGLEIVKLGGSLITDKAGEGALRPEVLQRLAREIAASRDAWSAGGLLVTHGSGSFGHAAASKHGLSAGAGPRASALGASATQAAAHRLHVHVVSALRAAGIDCWSYAPSSAVVFVDGVPASIAAEPLLRALDFGLVPVAFGDVVPDRQRGASICSTEALLRALLPELQRRGPVKRVLWLGETEGVWDTEGRVFEHVGPADRELLLAAARGSAETDVTGGMRLRVETALEMASAGVESWIGDGTVAGRLEKALRGEMVAGTVVGGGAVRRTP